MGQWVGGEGGGCCLKSISYECIKHETQSYSNDNFSSSRPEKLRVVKYYLYHRVSSM